jgi:hypothetical protein
VDVGIKYRGGTLLELKVRQELGPRIELGSGLTGSLEMWRKWGGADEFADIPASADRVDVHKVVVKRRFTLVGDEVAFTPHHDAGPACDVEVADVRVGSIAAWTLAFADFGRLRSRRPAVLSSWRTLSSDVPVPIVEFGEARAMGYPEWLMQTVAIAPAHARARLNGSAR